MRKIKKVIFSMAISIMLLPITLFAHEGKATAVLVEMANFHEQLMRNADAALDTRKIVELLRAGGDSQTVSAIFKDAITSAVQLGQAANRQSRLDLFAQLSEKLAPLHGHHDESGTNVFFCPMLKKKWIARGETVRNPYRADMPACGTIQH